MAIQVVKLRSNEIPRMRPKSVRKIARRLAFPDDDVVQLWLQAIINQNLPNERSHLLLGRRGEGDMSACVARVGASLESNPVQQLDEYLRRKRYPGIEVVMPDIILLLPHVIRLVSSSNVR